MTIRRLLVFLVAMIAACLVPSGSLLAQALSASTTQLIVRFRDAGPHAHLDSRERVLRLATDAGVALEHRRAMALGAHVVRLPRAMGVDEAAALAARLARHADVEYALPDQVRHALRFSNDEFLGAQAYLDNGATAISAFAAWDVTTGSAATVVAVIDTGIRPHADLAGRILPGYDFISDPVTANDGDGRDSDASDSGDWISAADLANPAFSGCSVRNSSWHGTGIAGIIAANTNNGIWVAGIDWAARILPVRVLGKCGGSDSDIIDGIAWAAGLSVPGVPSNPNPAQVINLSLGGPGSCHAGYRSVFDAALAHGVTRAIIVAAGNSGEDVAGDVPANCPQVIAVAATDATGRLATYSNFGAGITLSAPGGNPADLSVQIFVLSNAGVQTPAGDSFKAESGTSAAAPMVAGSATLMLAVAPSLTASQMRSILTATAKPFPAGSTCTTARCGTGIVNTYAAVLAARAAAPLNFEGLWYKSPAESEAGWGINFAHQGDVIFVTWFTYDVNGKAWWLTMSAGKTADNVYTGTLLETRGPAFNAVPFLPSAVTRNTVGTGTLSFADANNGTFAYTVNGVVQTKAITRQVFGPLPTCTWGAQPDLTGATNYQDIWYAAPAESESGWGVNFTHQGDNIFATWFTYDVDGTPLWLSATAAKTAPGVYAGALIRTAGPAFSAVPFSPAAVTRAPVGTLTVTFADGNHATYAYTVALPGQSSVTQAKSITRQVFRAPGTVCS